MKKLILYCICILLISSCKTTEEKLMRKIDRLQCKITEVKYMIDSCLLEYENYFDSTKTYQISEEEIINHQDWFVENTFNQYDPKFAIYPIPNHDSYRRRDSISLSFNEWLINQNVVNHRRLDSLFSLKQGTELENYISYIKKYREKTKIYFVGKIKSNGQYSSFLLLQNDDSTNKDLAYALYYLIQVNHRNGVVKSLVKVGCFISAGSALEEWTEKKKGKYLIMRKDADSNVFFPYDILKQMQQNGIKLEKQIQYYPYSIDKKNGWVIPKN